MGSRLKGLNNSCTFVQPPIPQLVSCHILALTFGGKCSEREFLVSVDAAFQKPVDKSITGKTGEAQVQQQPTQGKAFTVGKTYL